MTVSTTQIRVSYVGDGSSTVFTVPWLFYAATDLTVMLGYAVQSSGYSVSGAGTGSGSVTFSTAPLTGLTVQIILTVPLTQTTTLVDGTAFPSATLNQINDRAIQADLRLQDQLSRALVAPDGDVNPVMALPTAAARANSVLGFDSSGNATLVTSIPSGTLSRASIGALLYPIQPAETSVGAAIIDGSYPVGTVDRYGVNSVPGTTLMLGAIQTALNVLLASGGGTLSFAKPGDYFVGSVANSAGTLVTINGLSNVVINGNGARITCTTTSSGANVPTLFSFVNPNNLTFLNLRFFDSGYNATVDFQGVRALQFTATGSTDCGRIAFINCYFNQIVDPVPFQFTSGTARVKSIQHVNTYCDTCYYGPTCQEQGDDVYGSVTTWNCKRSYYVYGVKGHDVTINVHHDGVASAANANVIVKRYVNDTKNIKIRASFHGKVPHQTLVSVESQGLSNLSSLGITVPGAITGGSGYVNGVYSNVPLTGGSGSGATAQVTVAGGAVTAVVIVNGGAGYVAADNVSASNTNLGGSGSGFSLVVTGVGGVHRDIDLDIHLSDDVLPGAASQSIVGFRSYTAGSTVQSTCSDLFDEISIRGNFGAWNVAQLLNPIFVGSTQAVVGVLSVQESLFNAFAGFAQIFPGFVVRSTPNTYVYGWQQALTGVTGFIDLSQYDGRLWALKAKVYAEADMNLGATQQAYYEYSVWGYKTAGAVPTVSGSTADVTHTSGASPLVPTFTASGNGLNVTFTNYSGANAQLRMAVEHLSKFL